MPSPLARPLAEVTIACRVKIVGKNADQPVLMQSWSRQSEDVVEGVFLLRLLPANRISFSARLSNGEVVTLSGGKWKDQGWHHVAVTFGAGKISLFLDGSSVASAEYPAEQTLAGSSLPLIVGPVVDPNSRKKPILAGFLDDVAIWKTSKSQADLKSVVSSHLSRHKKDALLALPLRLTERLSKVKALVGPEASMSADLQRHGYGTTSPWHVGSGESESFSLRTYDFSVDQDPSDVPNIARGSRSYLVTNARSKQVGVVSQRVDGAINLVWMAPDLSGHVSHSLPSFEDSKLMAACSDKDGAVYYLLMANKQVATGQKLKTFIFKVDADGTEVKRRQLDTSVEALNASSTSWWGGSMRVSKSTLGLILPRRMHRGSDGLRHQGAIAVTLSSKSLQVLRNLGQTSGHSNGNVMELNNAGDFMAVDLGDNYPRGVHLHRFTKTNRESAVIFTYKTEHGRTPRNSKEVYEEISGNGKTFYKWSNDNGTYTELGGVVEGKRQYSVIVSTDRNEKGKVLDSSRAFRNCPDPRDLVMFRVKKNFGRGNSGSVISDKIFVGKTDKSLVETGGFFDFSGNWSPQRVTGMNWLTNYASGEHARSPQLISLDKGRIRLIWEKHSKTKPHRSTWTMVVDEKAKIVEPASSLGVYLQLNPRDQTVTLGDRVFLLASSVDDKPGRPLLCYF